MAVVQCKVTSVGQVGHSKNCICECNLKKHTKRNKHLFSSQGAASATLTKGDSTSAFYRYIKTNKKGTRFVKKKT
jgi:hypothetical protein